MSRWTSFLTTAIMVAVASVRRNPLRSGLTSLGILVGVAAVTIVVALGEGATAAVSGQIDTLGTNALIVEPEETAKSGLKGGQALPELSEGDAEALVRETASISAAAPVIGGFAQIAYMDANDGAQLIGTTRAYFAVRSWKVVDGELWSDSAEAIGEKVCVVGDTVKIEIFGGADPVGRVLRIGRNPFRVVGVLEKKGEAPFGGDQDDIVVLPIVAMRAKLSPTRPGQVHSILMSATSADRAEAAQTQATAILRQRHQIREGAEDDFRIRSQEQFRQMQSEILGVLSVLLLSIAGVSLVVGGVGVMNIMLVSVAERTREIGIRMAIGAREGDILVQFVVEAIVLALLGGVLGALVSYFAIAAIGRALDWPMQLSLRALGVALGTAAGVGLVFGFVPARRAARLDPIQALRRE